MKRETGINISLACCALLILAALGWMTQHVLSSEEGRVQALAKADVEQRAGLALARLDSQAGTMLLVENQRAPSDYRAVLWGGDVPAISPLFSSGHVWARLYFEVDSSGKLSSPQVPEGDDLEYLAKHLSTQVGSARWKNELRVLQATISAEGWQFPKVWQANDVVQDKSVPLPQAAREPMVEEKPLEMLKQAQTRAANEMVARKNVYQQEVKQVQKAAIDLSNQAWSAGDVRGERITSLSTLKPMWLGDELLLVRRVSSDRSTRYQGIWLDKAQLFHDLLQGTRDLFADAHLENVTTNQTAPDPSVMVTLPLRFVPGGAAPEVRGGWSSMKTSLVLGWVAALASMLVVWIFVRGTMRLSERRAAFVSAVSHELRTPLTTFRLYSDMLASGMITDDAKRRDYLLTMLAESERLNHLVENVLSFSRLERGSARRKPEQMSLGAMLEKVTPSLARRCEQEGAQLVVESTSQDECGMFDSASVEQILFNLVDNACKYGLSSSEDGKRVTLHAESDATQWLLRVCDSGKGVDSREVERIFRPFHKSAQDAAESKPGVGLGLALCRRLACEMGGELAIEQRAGKPGACFLLTLPRGNQELGSKSYRH